MLSRNPQPLAVTDLWLKLIRKMLDSKMNLSALPPSVDHLRQVLESTEEVSLNNYLVMLV